MKKLFVASLILFFTFSVQVNAQTNMERERLDRAEMLEKMKDRLDLTEYQVKQIKEINAKYEAQEKAFRERMKKLREEHKALRSQKKAEMDKVLTAEQRKKIKTMKEKRREHKKDVKRKIKRK